MNDDRRCAVRVAPPAGVSATVGGVPVRILDLSVNGALFEHEDRFAIAGARLEIVWQEQRASIPVRVVRTAIMSRRESRIVYQTGVHFMNADAMSEGVVASVIRLASIPAPPATSPSPAVGDDTWTRRVRMPAMEGEGDDTWTRRVKTRPIGEDDGSSYVCYRLTLDGWTREFVRSTAQPADGFTLSRDARDFAALQRAFENADASTRRKLQSAIEAQLQQK